MYRHDLARLWTPDLPANPHPYLVLFVSLGGSTIQLPPPTAWPSAWTPSSRSPTFVASDGANIADPNGLSALLLGIRVFEIPSVLPEDLGY